MVHNHGPYEEHVEHLLLQLARVLLLIAALGGAFHFKLDGGVLQSKAGAHVVGHELLQ